MSFSMTFKRCASVVSEPRLTSSEMAKWSKANILGGLQIFRLSSQVDCQLFPLDWKANIERIQPTKTKKL